MTQPTPTTVVELFRQRVAATPDAEAMAGRHGNDWRWTRWREVQTQVRAVAGGLLSLGLHKGERVAILAASRPEWVVADLAILWAGCATTTLYPSNTSDECAYILADAGVRLCFVENETLAGKVRPVRDGLPLLAQIVLIDGEPAAGDGWALSLAELERRGRDWEAAHPGSCDAAAAAVEPSDLATLIYTSGTSGPPKGVMLTHDNWVVEGAMIAALRLMGPEDLQLLFLPLAHSYAKALEVGFLQTGIRTAIDGNLDNLGANLAAIRPTVMGGVPRVFEKVYNRVVTGAKEGGGIKYKLFRWALDVGRRVSRLRQAGKEPGGALALQHKLASTLVYSKIKARFGGRLRFLASAGAPLAQEIAEFFHALDIQILEAYGLTETSGGSTGNRLERYRFGTVGLPLDGAEVKIAEDGEILIRGRHVMRGYFNRPEATAEAMGAGGWFHSGDIGHFDADGFLKITDRKKDLIITAGGKNVAPQNVENLLKASCPYLSQVVMLGDRRPFCVALLTLNEETCGKWAGERGIAFANAADLAAVEALQNEIRQAIATMNDRLPPHERIRNFRILDRDFSIETGELTPKMSVKRRVVEERHREALESLYQGTMASL